MPGPTSLDTALPLNRPQPTACGFDEDSGHASRAACTSQRRVSIGIEHNPVRLLHARTSPESAVVLKRLAPATHPSQTLRPNFSAHAHTILLLQLDSYQQTLWHFIDAMRTRTDDFGHRRACLEYFTRLLFDARLAHAQQREDPSILQGLVDAEAHMRLSSAGLQTNEAENDLWGQAAPAA